ncbi:MAG: arylesterase [Deltaproteobacteria bacterium]|nr:MAG: arylesterase [Deltaproteobacteria bacterium]
MRRNIIVTFTLFFSVLLFVGCDSGPKITALGQETVVLAFGDSLTYGTGAPVGQSYPDVLANLLGKPVINAGVPGEVSSAGLKRLPGMLDKYNPTLVVLCHGGNDFLRRLDREGTIHNLKAMLELIRDHGANVVFIGVPKLGFGLDVPKFYATIAEEQDIPYQGDILLDLLDNNSMKSDSIHPNATGYRLMAEAVYEVINKAQRK